MVHVDAMLVSSSTRSQTVWTVLNKYIHNFFNRKKRNQSETEVRGWLLYVPLFCSHSCETNTHTLSLHAATHSAGIKLNITWSQPLAPCTMSSDLGLPEDVSPDWRRLLAALLPAQERGAVDRQGAGLCVAGVTAGEWGGLLGPSQHCWWLNTHRQTGEGIRQLDGDMPWLWN